MEVWVTGAGGFIGRAVVHALVERSHRVSCLVRPTSSARFAPEVQIVRGDALAPDAWAERVPPHATWIHLVGTPSPAPWRARRFVDVDLESVRVALAVAARREVAHFVYLSVAQPAPVMRAYVAVRARGEALIAASGIPATFVRPWYVLGPGRRWPLALLPLYAMARALPATRNGAKRLAFVTLEQITGAIVGAVEAAPASTRVLDVPAIRTGDRRASGR